MKKVIEKARSPHTFGGYYESPDKKGCSWLKWSLKLQWVCMGKGLGYIYITYLNIESSKLNSVQGVHNSLIR